MNCSPTNKWMRHIGMSSSVDAYLSRFVNALSRFAMRWTRSACWVNVSSTWRFNTAMTTFRSVTAGSVITSCARATPAPSTTAAIAAIRTIRGSDIVNNPLRLAPRAQVIGGAADQIRASGASVAHPEQSHVHRGGFGVAHPLAAREELLEGMREQLVGRHVLPAREQFTGGDFVQDGRHLVVPRLRIQHVLLEGLDRLLQLAVIAAHQRNLMAADLRDGVRDFDGGVRVLNGLSRGRGQLVEQSPGSFQTTRGLLVQRAAGIPGIEPLQPWGGIRPATRIVSGDADRRNPILVERAETLRHPLDRLVLLEERVVFRKRTVGDQDGLREIAGINDHKLRPSRHREQQHCERE